MATDKMLVLEGRPDRIVGTPDVSAMLSRLANVTRSMVDKADAWDRKERIDA